MDATTEHTEMANSGPRPSPWNCPAWPQEATHRRCRPWTKDLTGWGPEAVSRPPSLKAILQGKSPTRWPPERPFWMAWFTWRSGAWKRCPAPHPALCRPAFPPPCAATITPVHRWQLHQGVWGSAEPV